MKLTCADCGFESDEAIVRDGLGWKGICPKCGQSFDVAIPRGLVVMMFADDSNPEKDVKNFVDDFKDAATIRTCYVFNSVADFAAAWRKMVGNPDGMWYFVLYKGKQIMSGACDDEKVRFCNRPERTGRGDDGGSGQRPNHGQRRPLFDLLPRGKGRERTERRDNGGAD